MKRASVRSGLIVALLLVSGLCTASRAGAADADASETQHVLVLGRISDDPKQHYESLRPLLDYVVPRMRSVGIREGRILMAQNSQQMVSYLRRGRVDWLTESPAMAVIYRDRAGARILLATERGSSDRYHSVFFARKDSGIRSLDDLVGRSVAFQNPNSTSSYVAPAAALIRHGLKLEQLLSPMDRPDARSVGFVFARSEVNISTWVHKRLVDAGAFANLDWNSLTRLPESYRNDLVIFHETQPFPRALEVVRPGMDQKVEARLREVLLGAATDPDAHDAMLSFFRTDRFVPLNAESEAALERLREDNNLVRNTLE